MNVIKKDGTLEEYNEQKIIDACNKAARRAMVELSDDDYKAICEAIMDRLVENDMEDTDIYDMHNIVEAVLEELYPVVAKMYKEYRNYKKDFVHMMDKVYERSQAIRYIGDKSNANTDSALVATKRSLIYSELSGELYKKFFLTLDEKQAAKDGYIYIHDRSSRLDTFNCCLCRVGEIMSGGFEMGNLWYNEPKTLDTAFDVIGDIILNTAAQQYGGFTIPEIDKILAPYAEKSYWKYRKEYADICGYIEVDNNIKINNTAGAELWVEEKIQRDFEQGWQGIEYKLNSVGSSRGDYPFITMTIGLATDKFGKMAAKTLLKVHQEGQGKKGFKRPVLFPKIVFLYDKNLHGDGSDKYPSADVFNAGIECSSKTMYPDWLSLTGEGYVSEMYKKYGKVISPMGCRAFLSPWYERGGMHPSDENDVPIFEGRFNMGVVSLNLPMILAKSRQESKDFYEVLNYYLEMIRGLHKRTIDYIGELRASTNPVMFCEGGLLWGTLKPDDKIKSLLPPMTISYGITALNELQRLYNGKSIREDGEFALEVMKYINEYVNRIKEEDGILYAIYGTPAESLCLSGDTVVQTYGGNKEIKDIASGDLVYSFNEAEHKIELKKVIASTMTKKNATVIKVVFDNGQEIICTPEHRFAVRCVSQDDKGMFDGRESIRYVQGQYLRVGDRIKSNYIHMNVDGRPECSIYHNGCKQLIQNINAEYSLGIKEDGWVTHHKDGNCQNNSFENLEYMLDREHRIHHMNETIKPYCYTPEQQKGNKNSFFGKKHTARARQLNRIKHINKPVVRTDLSGKVIDTFECVEDVKKRGFTTHLVGQACKGLRKINKQIKSPHYYKNSLWYYADIAECNHKVVAIEQIEETIPVYDIEVEDNHNFFVGGDQGILVHNCGLQVEQFRKKYGIVENVSDRTYVSNSFHCHVSEQMSPIEKQDKEERFWDLFNGGKIQYVRYPLGYNKEAIKTLVLRAMDKGFYEGVNLALCYCEDCGYQQVDMDICPKCGSSTITKIDRMNGYLGFTRVHGDTRYNKAKNDEIAERVSM